MLSRSIQEERAARRIDDREVAVFLSVVERARDVVRVGRIVGSEASEP